MDKNFWQGKKVFLTGHTGFKGSWLALWLHSLGAIVTGYALEPPTKSCLYELAQVDELIASSIGDINDYENVAQKLRESQAEIVFHLAAQPLVRKSYREPLNTYQTNVMGTANLLEAVCKSNSVQAVIIVTTDKCYKNNEWDWGYREIDELGGHDPYASSKACSELVVTAYRKSFFEQQNIRIATVRAGNVIGGGDWAEDRLIPDCLRSIQAGEKIILRNPEAIRPWQYVLEPLSGYLLLAEKLYTVGNKYNGAWNFGPCDSDAQPVEFLVKKLCQILKINDGYHIEKNSELHEARYLKLDCSKAKNELGWQEKGSVELTLEKIASWHKAYQAGEDIRAVCLAEIADYNN